jgi:hypothetical protein
MSAELWSQQNNNSRTGYSFLQSSTWNDLKAVTSELGTGSFQNLNVTNLTCGTGTFINLTAGTGTFISSLTSNGLLSVAGTGVITGFDANGVSLTLGGYLKKRQVFIQSFGSTAQSVTSATTTALIFDTDSTNINWGSRAAANTKFIAPITGYFEISYGINIGASQTVLVSDQFVANLRINGGAGLAKGGTYAPNSTNAGSTSTGALGLAQNGSTTVFLNVTDYVEVVVYQSNAGSISYGATSGTPSAANNICQVRYLGNWP